MITRILVLFFLSTEIFLVRGFEYHIDLNRCKTQETVCYVRKSCIEAEMMTDTKILRQIDSHKLRGESCDVIMQIKQYNKKKWHVMMQLNGTYSNKTLNSDNGIELFQKTTQFSCAPNGGKPSPNFKKAMKGSSIFTGDFIFCSFMITRIEEDKEIAPLFSSNNAKPSIRFSYAEGEADEIVYDKKGEELWNNRQLRCDPDTISTRNTTILNWRLSEIDSSYMDLQCQSPYHIIVKMNDNLEPVNSLLCTDDYFQFTKSGDPSTLIPITVSAFDAYCGVDFRTLCPPLPLFPCSPGRDCNSPSIPDPTGGRAKQCPGDKWRFKDDGGKIVETKVICNQSAKPGNELNSGWIRTIDNVEVDEGACSEKSDCQQYSALKFSCPPDLQCTSTKSADNRTISCEEGSTLKFTVAGRAQNETKKVKESEAVTCDDKSGLYMTSNGSIPESSIVYCEKIPDDPPKEAMAASTLGVVIGVPFVLIVICAIGGVFMMLRIKARRRLIASMDNPLTAIENEDWNCSTAHSPSARMLQEVELEEKRREEQRIKDEENKALVVPAEGLLKNWKDSTFYNDILPNFCRYSAENRRLCLRNLLLFSHYNGRADSQEYGTLKQFAMLIRRCTDDKLRCIETWETIFRIVKIIHHPITLQNDFLDIPKRMRKMMAEVGDRITTELGYRGRPFDTPFLTQLRCMAIRMLAWAEDSVTLEELERLGEAKIDRVEQQLRISVAGYMIHHMNKEKQIKNRFYDEIQNVATENPKDPKVAIGTMRQHLIFALCTMRNLGHKGTPDEFGCMKDVMNTVNERIQARKLAVFSPTDMLCAFKGALEYPASFPTAFEQFAKYTMTDPSKETELAAKEIGYTKEEELKLVEQFKVDQIEMCTLLVESCATPDQLKTVHKHCEGFLKYAKDYAGDFNSNIEILKVRTANLSMLQNDKKLISWLHDAMLSAKYT